MTCLVAVEHEDGVFVGADSFLGDDTSKDLVDRPKWFYRGRKLLVAYCGDLRAAQVAQYGTKPRRQRANEDDQAYIVRSVADAVRQAHKTFEVAPENEDEAFVFSYLVAYNGRIYTIQNDYSVVRSSHGYAATGAGADVALGALAALYGTVSPKECVLRALKAATRHCPQVAAPFHPVNVGASPRSGRSPDQIAGTSAPPLPPAQAPGNAPVARASGRRSRRSAAARPR
jgi:ATP-dependent protease HslVU (ClpYQ) peptidase subunit